MEGINFKKDRVEFDALNLRVLNYLKESDENLNATGWCKPVIHPTSKDMVFTVKDRILPALSSTEKKEIFTLGKDWFPKPETP